GNAILPDALGTIFSGSAVVDTDGSAGFGKEAVVAIYTQADISQMQGMSYSTDGGKSFITYKKNPILTLPYEARDPKVFRYEPAGKWIMVLASAPAHEVEFYSSDNLVDWTFESKFGRGYGCQDGVWECPDLMELDVRGTGGKRWVLICNINPGGIYGGSATQYFVGTFDGHRFLCDTGPGITRWMDYGKDHYAAVSWHNAPGGRHTMLAWMSNWQYAAAVPTTQYRSADTLPRDVELYRGDDGELYLASVPSPEVDLARGKMTSFGAFTASKKGVSKVVPETSRDACELDIELTADDAERVYITLSNGNNERVVMTYDLKASTFSMDRRESGVTGFSADFPCITTAPCADSKQLSLRLFFDHSSLEVFEGEGRFTMTNLVFPTEPYDTLTISCDTGKARVASAKLYEMK
ncbi:MAG: glycoside hydrolase family 32 protein, partial [Prevotellaceae bacterium]|nr:glycoside hydrolase family 32 protein [Prevotellaceae bacterium]